MPFRFVSFDKKAAAFVFLSPSSRLFFSRLIIKIIRETRTDDSPCSLSQGVQLISNAQVRLSLSSHVNDQLSLSSKERQIRNKQATSCQKKNKFSAQRERSIRHPLGPREEVSKESIKRSSHFSNHEYAERCSWSVGSERNHSFWYSTWQLNRFGAFIEWNNSV